MADRIDLEAIKKANPDNWMEPFMTPDTNNPNKNISASKYDPTDPTASEGSIGEKYNEWLRTANIGDTFDWFKESGNQTQKGLVNKFTGFNMAGTPMITTEVSAERQNWRGQINPSASVASNLDSLMNVGFGRQEALFMMAQSGLVDENAVAKFMTSTSGGAKTVVDKTTDAAGNVITTYSDGSKTLTTPNGVTSTVTTSNTATPSGTPTLARDVFKNTLALLFGQVEANKPWMDELYTVVSKYYKTGATAEEAFNLAVQDVRKNPNMQEFTKRFKGIYDLQDLRQQGKPVTVPTIAEYFATQTKMADLLKSTGLGEIATEDFLGSVIGKGVSATEFGNRITNIFDRIDLAPQEIKDTLSRYFPTLDRIQLAKALALGEKGSVQLQKDLATYEILGAAEEQGLGAYGTGAIAGGLTEERAASIAAGGDTFQSALGKFKTVAQMKESAAKLAAIYGTGPMTQADIENIVFKQSAQETTALQNLVSAEEAMFSARSGNIGSRSFASQARGAGLI